MTRAEESERRDDDLLALLTEGNEWLRAILCTLARRGAALRQRHPNRAARLIDTASRWPVFKGGQFLFDLMEWEDFMVDGTPPAPVPTVLTGSSWTQITRILRDAQQLVDPDARLPGGPAATVAARDADLPPLDPGLHLYTDVVLGIIGSAPRTKNRAARG
ncbi:hypothetical protein BJY24_000810 [Nocardia transvalensis]|uniref:Uncharacterized protein n=1 Tax=Nocardia transvalensis TaxID=37333 RepID=A0A7W9UG60_9NOCA|nr:hypothetical protein [Nocardia transvalensis]MBB5911943.1 hypothetical protein [Nocardia transvalensis]